MARPEDISITELCFTMVIGYLPDKLLPIKLLTHQYTRTPHGVRGDGPHLAYILSQCAVHYQYFQRFLSDFPSSTLYQVQCVIRNFSPQLRNRFSELHR